jgi:[ribosomal protein S5]-alanine N-acetyltransferase
MNNNELIDICLPLHTARLTLRQFEPNDLVNVYRQFADPDMCVYFSDPPCASTEEAQDIMNLYNRPEAGNELRWVMQRTADGAFIGTCGYHCRDRAANKVEIGYDVWKEHWRQGYASEALQPLLEVCFRILGVNKVYARLDPRNIASRRTLEKAGFAVEGLLRDYVVRSGEYLDMPLMALMRREWEAQIQ